jgi:hypothetical protein
MTPGHIGWHELYAGDLDRTLLRRRLNAATVNFRCYQNCSQQG